MKVHLPANPGEFIGRFWKYILLCVSPFLVALGFYVWKLGNLELSSTSDKWGQFSDFLMSSVTLSLGLGNLFLLYLLTRIANDLNETNLDKELSLQKKTLEKQLAFEIYKDFISRIDDYTIKYLSNRSDANSKLYLALIHTLADSAKDNFKDLIDDVNKESFESLINELCAETEKQFDNTNNQSVKEFTASISKIKTILFQQVKLDTK